MAKKEKGDTPLSATMSDGRDMQKLVECRNKLESLKNERKEYAQVAEELEQRAVHVLMQMGKSFIDESGDGRGPFWTLAKSTSSGAFTKDRQIVFFTELLRKIQQGSQPTPEQIVEGVKTYLEQFEKRKLVLHRNNTANPKDLDELKQWLQGGYHE